MLIGSPESNGIGKTYLIWGNTSFPARVNVEQLNGDDGICLQSSNEGMGISVTGLGDINGDGRDDIIIGAPGLIGNQG